MSNENHQVIDNEALMLAIRELSKDITGLNNKIDAVEERLNTKIDSLDVKIDAVEERLNKKIDTVEKTLSTKIDAVEERLGEKIDILDDKFSILSDDVVSTRTDVKRLKKARYTS
ncbi:hypothetical protein [Gracilibacillus timonensis]|uniref:hypothetical protein n=1 Tax=Gracilibacillus timonensis TaxID=1816696 RepID=UPI0008270170|nr:hypothetical protein [Gracilibacillus timonensis]